MVMNDYRGLETARESINLVVVVYFKSFRDFNESKTLDIISIRLIISSLNDIYIVQYLHKTKKSFYR